MGSLCRQNARNRLFDVIDERLDEADGPEKRESILNQCIDSLAHIGINSAEIDRVSQELATEESDVEFPNKSTSDEVDQ